MKAFIISGTGSGCGKTTISTALMLALNERIPVFPFKIGPDYIDPMFHRFALNSPSYNLDLPILGQEHLRNIFYSKTGRDGVYVCEGVMGLYDGALLSRDRPDYGSSAHLSGVLNLPVILILNVKGMGMSAAALARGFSRFGDITPDIRGFILNRVKSQRTFEILKKQIEEYTGIPVLGYFPEDENLTLNSRHLGLIPPEEVKDLKIKLLAAKDAVKEHIDLDRLLTLVKTEPAGPAGPDVFEGLDGAYPGLRIGVAYDEAFNFYYQDNLDLLTRLGCELLFFSPLNDSTLPEKLDGLYLGGGFPEVFAERLSLNTRMLESISAALESGLPCYAECGGQIYLTREVEYKAKTYPLVGFLPYKTVMTDRLNHFGYCRVKINKLFGRSFEINAHEFHHSRIEPQVSQPSVFTVIKGDKSWRGGFLKKNTLTGYPHLHFYAQPDGPELVKAALEFLVSRRRDESNR